MADRDRSYRTFDQVVRGDRTNYQSGPSTTQVLTVLTLLPIGGTLLALAGLTLTGTVIGLCMATPLFVIFSPVLVPAAIAVFMAVAGFLSSGAFGLTGLSSLSYVFNRFRQATGTEQLDADRAKRGMQDMVGYVGKIQDPTFLYHNLCDGSSQAETSTAEETLLFTTAVNTMRWPAVKSGGLGVVAMTYVAVDYLRILSPTWHERLQPVLWSLLALVAVTRIPFYRHWSAEFRAAISFLASMIFMLSALLFEACTVRFVTVVLGLNWHNGRPPLPDTGQWLLLALNEKLPEAVVEILRAHIIGLHHYLMLFIMLAFSVLFESVKAPGLGLGARYMFTMAVGRLLRAITFASTILPSARPWCASSRYSIPGHPHRWAQKYYVPYASDANAIRQVIERDIAYVDTVNYTADYRPDWGSMSFLIDFLRPNTSEGSSWYSLLKKAGGGCNDLVYSGHMFVAVLTAMAWTEAYGGFSSVLIWLLVMHSAQREVRERHHYSVDCVVAIYVGILLWKMTGFIWSAKGGTGDSRLTKLGKIQGRLLQAAKDSDMDEVRELLKDVELGNQESLKQGPSKVMWLFASGTIFFSLTIVILAFTWTSDG